MKILPNIVKDEFYVGFKFKANGIYCIITKINRTNNILEYKHPKFKHNGKISATIDLDRAKEFIFLGFWNKIE